MNFRTAKDQIIKIIKGVRPAAHTAIFSNSFRYLSYNENDENRLPSRAFFYEPLSFSTRSNQCFQKYRLSEIEFSIFYKGESSREQVFEAMASDYKLIADALLRVENWDRASSGIYLLAVDDDQVIEAEVDAEDEEGAYLRFNLQMHYTD